MPAMNDPLVQKASADLAAVREEILRLQARERKLKQFIDAYADDETAPTLSNSGYTGAALDNFKAAMMARRAAYGAPSESTTKGSVASAVQRILSDGKPRHTRELLELLKQEGVGLGGAADQILALSRILSQDKRFMPNRTLGWSLKK